MPNHGCLEVSLLHHYWWLNIAYTFCSWHYTMLKQLVKSHGCFHNPSIYPACVYIIRGSNCDITHFYCYLLIMVNLVLTSNQTPYYYESKFIFSRSRREKKIHLALRHHFIAKCVWRSLFWKPKYSRLERYWLCRSSAGWIIPLWKERAHIITIYVFYCQMIILT